MSEEDDEAPARLRWARMRFAIIGQLLASPPPPGEVGARIAELAKTPWRHPTTGDVLHISAKTIERMYYAVRGETDPIRALERKAPKHTGTHPSITPELGAVIEDQYREHPGWSYQLHYDNLLVVARNFLAITTMPAYATVRRFMKHHGFSIVIGDPGTSKSVVLRLLDGRLRAIPNAVVGTMERPQSRPADFYRELGDIFGVTLSAHNRWGGFKALRSRWCEHIASTLTRPVLILDEAQEAPTAVLSELRLLASKDLDSRQLLSVVFAGDARLPERFRTAELLPLGSRIRRRLVLDYASRDELCACLDHLLHVAGNPSLMTTELKATLADHAAGNYRVLMNLADELLVTAADRDLPRLDEKLYFEVFAPPQKPKPPPRKR